MKYLITLLIVAFSNGSSALAAEVISINKSSVATPVPPQSLKPEVTSPTSVGPVAIELITQKLNDPYRSFLIKEFSLSDAQELFCSTNHLIWDMAKLFYKDASGEDKLPYSFTSHSMGLSQIVPHSAEKMCEGEVPVALRAEYGEGDMRLVCQETSNLLEAMATDCPDDFKKAHKCFAEVRNQLYTNTSSSVKWSRLEHGVKDRIETVSLLKLSIMLCQAFKDAKVPYPPGVR